MTSLTILCTILCTILLVTLYTLLKLELNELQFVVHIARNSTKLLEIVHKLEIVLVPFADDTSIPLIIRVQPQSSSEGQISS